MCITLGAKLLHNWCTKVHLTYYLDDLEYGTQGSKDQQKSSGDVIGMITYRLFFPVLQHNIGIEQVLCGSWITKMQLWEMLILVGVIIKLLIWINQLITKHWLNEFALVCRSMARNGNFPLSAILEKERLHDSGANFTDWFHNVRIVLKGAKKDYFFYATLGVPPMDNATQAVHDLS